MAASTAPTRRAGSAVPRIAFRVTAIVEACTWIGLLIGMAVKYLGSGNEAGVHFFGPLHGAAFLAYLAASIWAAVRFGWSRNTLLVSLLASIPPLATWAYEMWALRTGRLDDSAVDTREPAPA